MVQPPLNGKNLVLQVMNHQKVSRVPWIVFAGIHAGKVKGYSPTEILTDKTKLLDALCEVNRIYQPDGQPVVFDLQIEAEVLGCKLKWAEKAPPAVVEHPLEKNAIIPTLKIDATSGRITMILDTMRALKTKIGDKTALFGLVTGPLTLAMHLRGVEFFMDLVRKKDYATNLIQYCVDRALEVVHLYIDAGIDVVAIVDPVVSQISPKHFKSYLTGPFKTLFDTIRAQKRNSSFFVCGDATKNIEVMCETGPDSIFVDENINMVETKKITDRFNIALGGNIPLTTTMLHGTQQDNMKYVIELLEKLPHDNLFIAPGCDMPYDTPIDNVIGVQQAVMDTVSVKKALESYTSAVKAIDVKLPDYNALPRPFIEVFTIDSAVCAACGYMADMAFSALKKFPGKVDVVEYKWTEKENIARAVKMGIKHLPCILINGELKYSSIIPNAEDFYAEIQKYLK